MTDMAPAQIVFTESDKGHFWRGRLLRRTKAVDVAWGKDRARPVTWQPYFDITENPDTGRCTAKMNGGPGLGGIRYATFPNVTEAQKAGVRWAARRFRVPAV